MRQPSRRILRPPRGQPLGRGAPAFGAARRVCVKPAPRAGKLLVTEVTMSTTDAVAPEQGAAPELQRSLKQRHMTMISLGGVIGAGLFVGSGAVMNQAGPAAVLSYVAAGALIVLVMRMLGEMAVANPAVGSFVQYCRSALGPWAGFSVGWLYWYFWAIVLAVEAVAGATILQRWIDAPVWLMSLILMTLLTATNLWSVKSYGEFEFWFASIKIAAIIAFIAIAAGFLLGVGSGDSPGLSNLTSHDGFFPAGPVT